MHIEPTCGCVVVVDVYAGHGGKLNDVPGEVFLVVSVGKGDDRLSARDGGRCEVPVPFAGHSRRMVLREVISFHRNLFQLADQNGQ
jgi:hypothetical protein